jgi:hypothetical protein
MVDIDGVTAAYDQARALRAEANDLVQKSMRLHKQADDLTAKANRAMSEWLMPPPSARRTTSKHTT